MSYPERVSFWVSGTKYYVEVDVAKADCNREPAHCHVTDGHRRIAQVWLPNCTFNTTPSEISHNDCKRILAAIEEQCSTLEYAYNFNRKYGSD